MLHSAFTASLVPNSSLCTAQISELRGIRATIDGASELEGPLMLRLRLPLRYYYDVLIRVPLGCSHE
jgi:hypothetical protein